MKRVIGLLGIAWLAAGGADTLSQEALSIARQSLIVDTHIDVPYRLRDAWEDVTRLTESGDFDLPRARSGGLNLVFMSIFVPAGHEQSGGGWQLANELIDGVEALATRAPQGLGLAPDTASVRRQFEQGRVSLAMGMENGTPLEGKLENLQLFYDRGIRYITLTHSKSNHISDSSYDENRQWNGLSPFGRQVVAEMNRLGIMIDISHLSDAAAAQAIELSAVPVIASHSSVRHFTPGWERNMSDELIRQLAAKDGVIQINFGSSFLTREAKAWQDRFNTARDAFKAEHGLAGNNDPAVKEFSKSYRLQHPYPYAAVSDVVAHIQYVRDLVGVEHVGLGSDFDGVGDSLPQGLKDASAYPNLIQGLLEKGFSHVDIKGILGENLMRVWGASEEYAERARTD